jgi:hypothetical protein
MKPKVRIRPKFLFGVEYWSGIIYVHIGPIELVW